MVYRLLLNWASTGTCWVAIASRSAWIADCDMAGVSTQTFGPNVAEAASGQMLAGSGAALAGACVPPTAASALAASAAARRTGRMVRRINGTSLCWRSQVVQVFPARKLDQPRAREKTSL